MVNPFYSIIVPVYNVEKYLNDCYQSISIQSFTDYEVIFINDGSTDLSGFLCDQISCKDQRVVVIHKENGGLSDARNYGIRKAKGKYIVFVDSDDMLHEGALSVLYELLVKKEYPDVVVNRIRYFSDDDMIGQECKYTFSSALEQVTIAESFQRLIKTKDYLPGAWTIVVKKSHIVENDIFFVKGLLHEDEQWTPRVIMTAGSIAFNNNCLYAYRQGRVGSITQLKSAKREKDKLWIVENLYQESKKERYPLQASIAFVERAADLYWGVLVRSYQYSNVSNEYSDLIYKLNSLKYIFGKSKKAKYFVCSLFISLIGMRGMSFIFNKIGKEKLSNN